MISFYKNLVYFIIRKTFSAINCFLSQRTKVDSKSSAAVYKIWFRVEPSKLEFSSVNNFFGIFEEYRHPRLVLSDNISLYTITEHEVVFVDCGDVDVFCSKNGAFIYDTQYLNAKKFITLPIKSFHKIVQEISLPQVPILHVASHGRCGSTILSQIFEKIPNALSISEPQPFFDLAELSRHGRLDSETLKKLCFSTIMCTFKHANSRQSKFIFIKCHNVAVYITDLMAASVPTMKHVYLYRQPISFVRSCEKLCAANNRTYISASRTQQFSGLGHNSILQDFPIYSDNVLENLTSFSKLSLNWITGAAAFKMLLRKIDIKSITFEDLLMDADGLVLKLFKHVGVSKELLPDTTSVLKNDSQAGTAFTTRHMNQEILDKACAPISDKIKSEVDGLCRDFDVPRFWDFVMLPEKL